MRKALPLLLAPVLLLGCSNGDTARLPQPRAKPAPRALTLEVRSASRKVTTNPTAIIRGRVTPGTRVEVGTKNARVRGGRFRIRVLLEVGVNRIKIVATKLGYATARKRLTRRRTPPPVSAAATGPPQRQQGAQQCPPGQAPSKSGSGCTSECGSDSADQGGCSTDSATSCPAGERYDESLPACVSAGPDPNDPALGDPSYSECVEGYRQTKGGGCVPE